MVEMAKRLTVARGEGCGIGEGGGLCYKKGSL